MVLRPGAASLVTLAVPGLGHLLIGRPARGLIAFLTTVGLFAIGYTALGDRLWHLSPVPAEGFLRYFPVLLQPEFVNLGCTTLVSFFRDVDAADARHILLPRSGEHLWMFVSGASGFAAAFWAADALWIAGGARRARATPMFAAVLSWIVPGSGHVLAGQKSKGILLGAVVLVTFALGLALGEGHSCDRAQMPFWWAGQSVCGGGVAFAALFTGPLKMESYPALLDLGVILCTIAGLMNAIVITDAWSVAERPAPREGTEAATAEAAT